MDTRIKLNDVEYVNAELYDALVMDIEKKSIPEKRKSMINPENVMALYQVRDEFVDKFMIELYDFTGKFQKIGIAEEELGLWRLNSEKLVTENGTIISMEYYKKAKNILRDLKNDKYPLLYMKYDEKESKVAKNFPLLFVSHNVCLMIAPRIEDE